MGICEQMTAVCEQPACGTSSSMALGVTCFLQTQKKPAVLYNFLLETMSYVKSNLSRIRIAACNLAGEQAGLLMQEGP